jgi:hypothetical protein
MASDAIFAQLQMGINFDKSKFKKQIAIFEKKEGDESAQGESRMHARSVVHACMCVRCLSTMQAPALH